MRNFLNTSNKRIAAGAVLGYIALALSILSGLLFTPWIIKAISNSNYGLYTMSNSIITLFLFDFGLSATTNSYLSKLKANKDEESIKKFLGIIYKLYFLIDFIMLLIYILILIFANYIYVQLSPEDLSSFKIIFIITAFFSLIGFPTTTINGIFMAYEKFSLIKILDIIHKIIYIILTSICIFCKLGLYALVLANCLSSLIIVILKIFFYKKIGVKADFKNPIDKNLLKIILSFSVWAAINSIAARLVFNIMPSLFGIIPSKEEATTSSAIFGVASALEEYIYTFGSVLGGFFLPRIQAIRAAKNKTQTDIDNLSCKVGRFQLILIGLVIVGFICCGKEFILIWINGDETYIPAYYGVILMILYHLIYVPQVVYYTQMMSENIYIKKLCIATICKAAINLILAIALIYFFGAYGAFLSIFISRTIELIIENFLYKKVLHADLKLFFKRVYLKMIIPMVLSLSIGLILHFTLNFTCLINFFIIGIATLLTYCLFVYLLSTSKEEKQYLNILIKNKIRKTKTK